MLNGSGAVSAVRAKTHFHQNSLHIRQGVAHDYICTSGIQVRMIARIILWSDISVAVQVGRPPVNDRIGTLLDRSKGSLITLPPSPDEDDCATLGANPANDFC